MRKIQLLVSMVTLTAMLLSACGGPTPTPAAMMDKPTEAMMDKPTDAMMEKATATPEAMMDKPTEAMMEKPTDAMMNTTATPAAMMDAPAWFAASLTDVSSGKTFSINDLKGKVILVETMAQWCPNCKKQQGEVKVLLGKLGMKDDFVAIGLDIDPNENAADLKNYVMTNGFDWLYAVPPLDVSREIAKLYGDQFLNPPSTPILIIDRKGVAHPLPFGIKSADDLFKVVDQYLKEGV